MKKFLRNVTMAVVAIVFGFGAANAETTVLLDVNFAEKCTAGSEDAPQMFKYSSDFTTSLGFTGWTLSSASKAGQAGGSLYLADGGSVRTPYLSGVSTSNGAIKVTLEVKLNKSTMGVAQLKWGYATTENAEIYTGDWTTVEYLIVPTSASSYSNYAEIKPFLVFDGMFLKSIKIEQSKDFLAAPTANLPTDADGTSFTAQWKAVSGATKYFIDVYSYGASDEKVMFLDNQEVVPELPDAYFVSYKVENLDAATTYYYVVRAANETGVSKDSEEIEVVKVISALDKPVVTVNASADGTYTATWEAVADAESYDVKVVSKKTLVEPGPATVFSESFDCFTTGTIYDYKYAYDRHLEMLGMPGWSGADMIYYEGGMGLSPYMSGESFLATPAMDLSADNGTVVVKLTAAAIKIGASFTTEGSLRFSLIDAEGNVSQAVDVTFDKENFNEYEIRLEGGTAASKVKIADYTNNSSIRYFFNDIKIEQVRPAGFVYTSLYESAEVATPTFSSSIVKEDNTEYYITVTASATTVVGGSVGVIFSETSDEVLISEKSGVENVTVGEEAVAVKSLGNGVIEVTSVADIMVEVYDLSGRKLAVEAIEAGVTTLNLNASGVAIVKAGDAVSKVIL